MKLFPKVPIAVARDLAATWATTPVSELVGASMLDHPSALYAPVGGTRAHESDVASLRDSIREAARAFGYPHMASESDRVAFDARASRLLAAQMEISANEAADTRLWAFIACCVAPDVVRWRFPGSEVGTSEERFIGKARGLRNTFGRLWWRAHVLTIGPDGADDPIGRLGEDELVQITERPNLAGSTRLASQLADSFLEANLRYPSLSRSILMRDSMKRIRRLAAFVDFDALEDDALVDLVDDVFETSARVTSAAAHRSD